MSECGEEGCKLPARVRGMCRPHYLKRWRAGTLGEVRRHAASAAEALARHTLRVGDCLVWQRGVGERDGYGRVQHEGRTQLVHRVAWELANGPIPDGMFVNHRCWNRACVEVSHLELVTRAENNRYLSGPQKNSQLGIRNVIEHRGGYLVQVGTPPRVHRRWFKDLEEAISDADQARKSMFGEYAGEGVPA